MGAKRIDLSTNRIPILGKPKNLPPQISAPSVSMHPSWWEVSPIIAPVDRRIPRFSHQRKFSQRLWQYFCRIQRSSAEFAAISAAVASLHPASRHLGRHQWVAQITNKPGWRSLVARRNLSWLGDVSFTIRKLTSTSKLDFCPYLPGGNILGVTTFW